MGWTLGMDWCILAIAQSLNIRWGMLEISSMRAVKLATYMTRNGLIAICFVLFLIGGTGHAYGLDPSKRLTQYRHSTWRIQDGFLPSNPSWVSQTADGYLWVGGPSSGAFRFDGVRFVPWPAPALTSKRAYLFLPAKSGGFGLAIPVGSVTYEAISSFRTST